MEPFEPMNIADVAQKMGICERTVRNMVDAGEVPQPKKVGGHLLWHPDVFWAWFDDYLRHPERDERLETLKGRSQRPAFAAARQSAGPRKGKGKVGTSSPVLQRMHTLVNAAQNGESRRMSPPSPTDSAAIISSMEQGGPKNLHEPLSPVHLQSSDL